MSNPDTEGRDLKCSIVPFGVKEGDGYWHGRAISLDGTAATLPVSEADVAEVLFDYDSGGRWDGDCCAVVRLKDGRLVAWESWWGPTGTGFLEDAYGGDTDIYFATDLRLLVNAALSDAMRRSANVPEELWIR